MGLVLLLKQRAASGTAEDSVFWDKCHQPKLRVGSKSAVYLCVQTHARVYSSIFRSVLNSSHSFVCHPQFVIGAVAVRGVERSSCPLSVGDPVCKTN